MVPQHLRPFFWDVSPDGFDPASHPQYTITRLLEHGDQDAVGWLRKSFTEGQIKEVLRTERRLSRRSANFWALVYHIDPQEVAALKRAGSDSLFPAA